MDKYLVEQYFKDTDVAVLLVFSLARKGIAALLVGAGVLLINRQSAQTAPAIAPPTKPVVQSRKDHTRSHLPYAESKMINKALHARLETPIFAVARRHLFGHLAGTLICINVSIAQKTNIFSMELRLTSTAFGRDGTIPTRFTCDGADVSPHLAWSDPPAETRSFAIVCSDPDAPSGIWYHWAVFDIPAGTDALAEHHPPKSAMGRQAINDFGTQGYGGPCPPRGHGTHHYHFTLYALNVEHLGIPVGARCRDVEKAAKAHAIATAKLIGLYTR